MYLQDKKNKEAAHYRPNKQSPLGFEIMPCEPVPETHKINHTIPSSKPKKPTNVIIRANPCNPK